MQKHIQEEYESIPYEFDMVYEQDSFEETLKKVKKFNPLLIIPASEAGVRLATKLSHELGLVGNSIENLDAMTLKHEMHNRLAQKGIRSIKGKIVHSLAEVLDFYDSESLKEVVLKPIYSAASANVRICLNRDEVIQSAKLLLDDYNVYGDNISEILIQERIKGVEYIVNTVSRDGVPCVTTVWKYNKIKTSEGANVYDSIETVNELNLGEAELIEYAYEVIDALGIKYGPVHGEYMMDKDGPVLIEVNCRPMGADLPVAEPHASMIVDIGGGTTEVAVISLGGMVVAKSIDVAGDELTECIVQYFRKKYNLIVGETTAEEVKINLGSVYPLKEEKSMEVKGRDQTQGLPRTLTVTSEEIRQALMEPVRLILDVIKSTLEETPPELAADLVDRGLMVAGGGSLLRGITELIRKETDIPVHRAADPLNCVALGTGKYLEQLNEKGSRFWGFHRKSF